AGGFAGGGLFYGTSAASPNVGAVIALLRSFAPNSEPDAAHWKTLVMDNANPDALTNYTKDFGGAGLVDANASLAKLDPPITAKITAPTGAVTKVKTNSAVNFKGECDYGGKENLSYDWSFGDSQIPDSHQLNPAPVKYSHAGTYQVTFSCSDSFQTQSARVSIQVTKPPSGGGGGAFGGLGLGLLAALSGIVVLLRRRR
ncbi:MAG: PKD domain-containing protein, partial [Gammaproteobacteria bacterium]